MRGRDFRPKQTLGQNFLVDENIARKIADAIAPVPDDFIVEIGPGFGALTKHLIHRAGHILGVEIDQHLADALRMQFGGADNFEVLCEDFLKLDLARVDTRGKRLRIVGNIPYYITSPVIFKIFEGTCPVADMTLMIQREVAERIVAVPRTKAYGILSVVSQLYAVPALLFHVSRNVFKPRPEVASTVVRWDIAAAPRHAIKDELLLRRVIRATFNQRRKMLRKSLQQLPEYQGNAILPIRLEQRPEELTVEEFIILSNALTSS